MSTTVKTVSFSSTKPDGLENPRNMHAPTGSSEAGFTFAGAYIDSNDDGKVVVVLEANAAMNQGAVESSMPNHVQIDQLGGKYCSLKLNSADLENWTVSVYTATDKTNQKKETFVAGTGGGPRG